MKKARLLVLTREFTEEELLGSEITNILALADGKYASLVFLDDQIVDFELALENAFHTLRRVVVKRDGA